MKAILEFDVPGSCRECPFRRINTPRIGGQSSISYSVICGIPWVNRVTHYDDEDTRAPFCPLKIVPELLQEAGI